MKSCRSNTTRLVGIYITIEAIRIKVTFSFLLPLTGPMKHGTRVGGRAVAEIRDPTQLEEEEAPMEDAEVHLTTE
jgi:hypothetical protein